MNRLIRSTLFLLLSMTASMTAWAENTHYEMRVDGLACPYCAYGIEKKLSAIEGVHNLNVDLEKGLVSVDVTEGVVLEETDMKVLFNDAGFTYRSMHTQPAGDNGETDKP